MKTACLLIGAVAYVHGASIIPVSPSGTPLVATNGVQDFTWKYPTQTLTGSLDPNMWHTLDTTANTGSTLCSDTTVGQRQSPINIVAASTAVAAADIGAVTTTNFDIDIRGVLVNTGRVLRWMALGSAKPTIRGGPLAANRVYSLSHIDFHFGSTDTTGSEHTLDGTQLPMEMEMVFFDSTSFSTMAAAQANAVDASTANSDDIATISQLFNTAAGTADNAGLAPIVTQITNILSADPTARKKREARQGRQTAFGTQVDLSAASGNLADNVVINIEDIIGRTSIDNYFHYDGSMTEPNCFENTRWIINRDMAMISAAQLTAFRTLVTSRAAAGTTDSLANNFRPVQDLNGRTVGRRDAPFTINEDKLRVLGATLVGVGVFNTVNELLNQPDVAKSLVENPLSTFLNNIDLNPFSEQSVVQQRSSVDAAPGQQQQYAPAYPQPVYQPGQGYQQYAPQPLPAQTQ